jgi:hypothetical protein
MEIETRSYKSDREGSGSIEHDRASSTPSSEALSLIIEIQGRLRGPAGAKNERAAAKGRERGLGTVAKGSAQCAIIYIYIYIYIYIPIVRPQGQRTFCAYPSRPTRCAAAGAERRAERLG